MNVQKRALSYWCFPRLIKVTLYIYPTCSETYWWPSCWRWSTAPGCYSSGWRLSTLSQALEARMTLSGASVFLPLSHWSFFSPRSLILGIALPVMAFTILSFPLVLIIAIWSTVKIWKIFEVLYIGGSKVSLPDSCAAVFPPRWSLKSNADEYKNNFWSRSRRLGGCTSFLLRRCCEICACCKKWSEMDPNQCCALRTWFLEISKSCSTE